MPSPEAMRAAYRIATERYGSAGGNYAADAEIIDSEFDFLRQQLADVTRERDRLREACEAIVKTSGHGNAIAKCRTALSQPERTQP